MLNFREIAVVGTGLIGASLAAAFKNIDSEIKITAVDRSEKSLKKAKQLKIIDQSFKSIENNLETADLIFIAVPVASIPTVIRQIKAGGESNQLLVDVGSTKKEIMIQADKILKGSNKTFFGGHPMAGSHKSGIDWHNPDLFKDAPFILTPWLDDEQKEKIEFSLEKQEKLDGLINLIKKTGAKLHLISAEEHDHCTAYLSHFPHLLSALLINMSEGKQFKKEFFKLAGGGFTDMTRIAGSSPELWLDIILSNQENLIELIDKSILDLAKLKRNLELNDQKKVYNFLLKAAEIKKMQLKTKNSREK